MILLIFQAAMNSVRDGTFYHLLPEKENPGFLASLQRTSRTLRLIWGAGAAVRALASHPGLIPGLGVICGLGLLFVLIPAPRLSSLESYGFSSLASPQKLTLLHSNWAWNSRTVSLLVAQLLSVTLAKQSWLNKVDWFVDYGTGAEYRGIAWVVRGTS